MDIKKIDGFDITAKNLINKYNNSIYESYDDEEVILLMGIYNAS